MSEGFVTIKKGREKPILQQHPWIFSGAIASAQNAAPGDIVTIVAHDGSFLARGYWNPHSQIQVRILTWQDQPIDDDWWQRMLQRAVDARGLSNIRYAERGEPIAYRLIHAENDFLPGLIVDRYADWLVIQALTLGIDTRKTLIADLLANLVKPRGIYERSDVDVRDKEGLSSAKGLLWGEEPPGTITIHEVVMILVDIRRGQKTGLYLDQAVNRYGLYRLLSENFSGECRLLNLFSYTGGFGLDALAAGGIHVVNVDSSREALDLADKSAELNKFHLSPHGQSYEFIQADVFHYLRDAVERADQYDIVILDPPKFAHNKQQIEKAARGYKDINLNAFKLVKPGGYLMTFSCSGAISPDLFQKIVFGALVDSGRQAQIIQCLGASDDHPVALTFPEGAYLKGLLLRVY